MFSLEWTRSTINELARIWMNSSASQRKLITRATHQIESRLKHDPENEGESRSRGVRIIFEAPLGVVFSVHADAKKVRVLGIWRFDTH